MVKFKPNNWFDQYLTGLCCFFQLPLSLLKTAQSHPMVSWISLHIYRFSQLRHNAVHYTHNTKTVVGIWFEYQNILINNALIVLTVGWIEEWRNIQWASCELRHMDEYQFAWSDLHIKGLQWHNTKQIDINHLMRLFPLCRMVIGSGVCRSATFVEAQSSTCESQTKWSTWWRKTLKWRPEIAKRWKATATNRIKDKVWVVPKAAIKTGPISNSETREIKEIAAISSTTKNHNSPNEHAHTIIHPDVMCFNLKFNW